MSAICYTGIVTLPLDSTTSDERMFLASRPFQGHQEELEIAILRTRQKKVHLVRNRVVRRS